MSVEFISGKDHYGKVIEKVTSVKKSLWIGTADIKVNIPLSALTES